MLSLRNRSGVSLELIKDEGDFCQRYKKLFGIVLSILQDLNYEIDSLSFVRGVHYTVDDMFPFEIAYQVGERGNDFTTKIIAMRLHFQEGENGEEVIAAIAESSLSSYKADLTMSEALAKEKYPVKRMRKEA